jgi:hypothetical protein
MARSSITSNADHRFDVDWRYGVTEGGEALVRYVLGEVDAGSVRIEVKRKRLADWKFYVELEHDPGRKGRYIPSGLSISEAALWWFVIADTGISHVTPAAVVRTAVERNYGHPAEERDGSCPTRGRLLDFFDLLNAAKPGAPSRAKFGDSRWQA